MTIWRIESIFTLVISFITPDESKLYHYFVWLYLGNSVAFMIAENILFRRFCAEKNHNFSYDLTHISVCFVFSVYFASYCNQKHLTICSETFFTTIHALFENIAILSKLFLSYLLLKKYGFLKIKII
jgi:hypothetical protein